MVRSQGVHEMTELTIGRLADEAGVNVETIRNYQRRGLIRSRRGRTTGTAGMPVRLSSAFASSSARRCWASPSRRSAACSVSMRPMLVRQLAGHKS